MKYEYSEGRLTRERCGWCHEYSAVGFWVPDEIWAQATPARSRNTIACIGCFAKMADERLVDWSKNIKFYPVSLKDHLEFCEYAAPNPTTGHPGGLSGLKTSPELLALIERAKNHVMTPEEVYEQRRSFARGMCPSHRDYKEWCEQIDKLMPPLGGNQSDGGVEGHAIGRPVRSESEQGSQCHAEAISRSAIPAGRPFNAEGPRAGKSDCSPDKLTSVSALKHRAHSEGIEALSNDAGAGIKPGPSDTAPAEPVAWRDIIKRPDERPLPTYGQIPWSQLGRDVVESTTARRDDYKFAENLYPGHQIVPGINFNSLARIVDKYRYYGLPCDAHPPRSVDVGAVHQKIFMRVHDALDGKITTDLMSNEVWLATEQAARSIAAMIEGK